MNKPQEKTVFFETDGATGPEILTPEKQAARIVARAGTWPKGPFAEITEASIEQQVRRFYGRILLDEALGPIFMKAIPGDWEPHLARMFAFWSSVMLGSGRYKGNPFQAHARHPEIQPEHFALWLNHWAATSEALFTADLAARFQAKARNIAASLTAGLFVLSPGQKTVDQTLPQG